MSEFRLKVFISVARHLSFTKAAQELHLSQPAISKHVRELEEQYHTRLFERSKGTIQLTKAGEVMLYHCEHIVEKYNLMEFEINQLNSNFSCEIRLGASSTVSQYVIPTLLGMFIKHYPDVKLNVISGNSQEIESAMNENKIDIGIVEGFHNDPGMRYSRFMKDEIVLVTRTNGIYGALDEIQPDKLASLPIIIREYGSGTLEVIEEKLNANKLKLNALNIILQLGSTEGIKSFLQQSDCVAFVSIQSILNELKVGSLKIIEISDISFDRELRFITPYGVQNPMIDKFMEFALKYNKKL